MDAVIFILIAIFLIAKPDNVMSSNGSTAENVAIEPEDMTRVGKLNDAFYHDEDAFMVLAHSLGFNNDNIEV